MKGVGASNTKSYGIGKMHTNTHGVGKMRGNESDERKKSLAAAADLAKLFEKKK